MFGLILEVLIFERNSDYDPRGMKIVVEGSSFLQELRRE